MNNGNGDTLIRQWAMLRMIPRAPRKTSVTELLAQLEEEGFTTTRRTIERDLQNLSSQFQLVSDESSRPFGWSWAQDANIAFAPRLSPSQGVALLLARAHLQHLLPRSALKDLSSVFELAEKEVASTGWKNWHRRTAVIPTTVPLLAPDTSTKVHEDVHHALALGRCILGTYRSKGQDAAREMLIHPLGLLVRGSAQYLVCTLREYKDIRHLALHRFTHTRVVDVPAREPDGFDFSRYVASTATKYQANGKTRLVIHLTAEAVEHLRETPLSRDQAVRDLPDGRTELIATVERDDTLRWWLLGFGSRVEVIEPVSLRDELSDELRRALGRYGSVS